MDVGIRLLGPTEVGVGGRGDEPAARVLSPRDRVILSALCVQPGHAVAAETLADALWGEAPPKSWGKIVQGSVMRLRRAVGSATIETTAGGYRIVLPDGQLDTVEFERLVSRGRSFLALHEPERAASTFERALALWRGAPFPELAEWEQARSEGGRLLEVRRAVEEDLVEAHLAAGRAGDAVAEARPLVAREPYRERRWALLATALYRTGRQGEALEVLRRASRTVRDELGLDPGPELVRLEQRILQQDPSLMDVPNRIGGSSATCPYRGLRPFEAQDADFYFGRAGVVAEAVRRLGEFPLLLVVGPSGSGKSSFVRAGIVPAMARAGHPASVLVPGPNPPAALTTAVAALRRDGLLVVDQLEEAFAGDIGRGAGREFLDQIAALAEHGTRVVATLRADYLGWLAESPALSRLVEHGLLLLTSLTDDELRSAIEEPAGLVGLMLEPGLVDLLLRDVADAPGGLPLLSHALAETWEQREGSVLTVEGYRSTGGIRSAVANSAERLYESLTSSDRDLLRSVMQRLVAPAPAGEPVAARVPTRVFAGTPQAARLLDLLVRSRLVTVSQDTATIAHESLVRAWPRLRTWLDEDLEGQRILAHLQATADTWDFLGRPDDELYRGARLAAAQEWRQRARPVLAPAEESFLAAALARADDERLRRERDHALQVRRNRQLRGALAAVAALLVIALAAGTLAGLNSRAARTEAARATSEAARADQAALDAIAARLAETALSGPNPGLSLLLARQAVALSETSTTQGALLTGLMNAQGLVGLAQSKWGPSTDTFDHAFSPDGDVLLHLNSRWELDTLNTTTGISLHGALASTQWGLAASQTNWSGYPTGLIEDGRVAVLSQELRSTTATPGRQDNPIALLQVDVRTGDPAGTPQEVPGAVDIYGDAVTDHADRLRISPDGRTLVSVLDGRVRIWHRSGERWTGPRSVPIPGLGRQDAARSRLVGATFSVSGTHASVLFDVGPAAADQGTGGVVVDLDRARLLGPRYLPDGRGALSHMALSPDGTKVLVGDSEGAVLVRDVADDQVLSALPGGSTATVVAWSSDGRRVAIGRLDGTSEVFSVEPLQRIMTSAGSDRVSALAFVGEQGLVRESITGSIARYDLGALSPVATKVSTAPSHALATAGGLVASGGDDGRITIRDQRTLEQLGAALSLGPYSSRLDAGATAAGRRVTALALLPDGSGVIAADRSGHLRMWSLPERELLWSRDDVPTSWLAVSPDGRYLATVGTAREGGAAQSDPVTSSLTVWDLATHEVHLSEELNNMSLEPQRGVNQTAILVPTPRSVVFSPDSTRVAIAYLDGFVMIYDLALRRRTEMLLTFQTAPSSIAFSPDGSRLLAASPDYLRVWDAATGEHLTRTFVPAMRDLTRIAYTDDGKWLVISHPRHLTVLDGRTLDVAVANVPLPTAGSTDAFPVAAGQDHHLLVGTGQLLASIDMDPETWKAAACQVVDRTLTRDEWDRFLPSMPYAPACG